MRTIDADALMPLFIENANLMKDRHGVKLGEEWLLNYNDIKDVIDNAPTVCNDNYAMGYQDGVKKVLSERPTGRWIDTGVVDELGHVAFECSVCHKSDEREETEKNVPFCKYCGAGMGVSHE